MTNINNLENAVFEYRVVHNISKSKFAKLANLSRPTLLEALKGNASPFTLKKIELVLKGKIQMLEGAK